jgi:hypothetical protein
MSTLMRGLVGLNALASPARLQLAPQLPASWGWLKIRNLRWQQITADVSITRNAGGISVEVSPRGGALPLELHAILPPGSTQLTRDLLWRPVVPGGSTSRGLHLVRRENVSARTVFAVRAAPGVRVVPLHAPLELGDVSSRLRVIDATLEGSTYTLRVEGRRGRSYELRLLAPPVVSLEGATLVTPPAGASGRPEGQLLRIDMPPADPAASGAVLKRSDWAAATVTVRLGESRR